MGKPFRHARLAGLAVHMLTASGAAAGLMALWAAFAQQMSAMFAWLGLALLIDAADGPLARWVRVREVQPDIDGDLLDLVVDYLTYVVVPVAALMTCDLLPPSLAIVLPLAVAVASAVYFADRRMKTPDLWFRGFPAIWNVLVFYLVAFGTGQVVNACIVTVATIAMFAPVVFVHPVRVTRLRPVTSIATILFAVAAAGLVAKDFAPNVALRAVLAGCALYFLALPFIRGRAMESE
jgi:phosphatidylcholine synthase